MKKTNPQNILFGKHLQNLRKRKGVSVAEISRTLEVAPSTYREWEHGRAVTGQPYLKLAQILQVSLNELLGVNESDKGEVLQRLHQIESLIHEIRTKI